MRTRLPALLLGVLLAGQACGHTSPLLAPVRQIHAFGDSYSDNGESQRLTREMLAKGIAGAQALPGEVYWQGRWSNGRPPSRYSPASSAHNWPTMRWAAPRAERTTTTAG